MHQPVVDALDLVMQGELEGGEHGALLVRRRNGDLAVLKVFGIERAARLRTAAEMTGHLRALGASAPHGYTAGVVEQRAYSLQDHIDGSVPQMLDDALAEFLLAQWQLRQGAAPATRDWAAEVERALRQGSWFFYAQHEPIRAAGGRASALLDEIVAVGRGRELGALRAGDIVHGDYHHRNLVVGVDGAATIIDWDDAAPGDGRYDLVILAYWTSVYRDVGVRPDAADRIRAAIDAHDPIAIAVLRALFALHLLWFVAAIRPERLPETVAGIEAHLAPSWRAIV
jgi:aminoglycoside phosphotransferase (APT) family kinase protein